MFTNFTSWFIVETTETLLGFWRAELTAVFDNAVEIAADISLILPSFVIF